MEAARRLEQIGAYLFADLDRRQAELQAKGVDVINLSVGDPDLPPPPHIIDALLEGATDARSHRYPPYAGTLEYRTAVADWYRRRFNVALDPATEVLALIGSKEGLAHLPWALLNPGDVALVPDPGYPVYRSATIMAEGIPYTMPLRADRGFLPDLDAVPAEVLRRAKLMFLNYPNNPTAATATHDFFREAVAFARRHGLLLAHDNSYSEIAYDGYRPPSILEADGAKEVAVEFHSLSKTYCMTGWRIGFVVGNAEAVGLLGKIKTNIDSGVFRAVQHAAIAALTGPPEPVQDRLRVYQGRRDRVMAAMRHLGWAVPELKATFYLWIPVPGGGSGAAFAAQVLERTGVLLTPGAGYGREGEGYVRLSITVPDGRLDEALDRLRGAFGRG
ncbi:MAG: LL-diaminopimelate aminotransferase [Armatimonadota bacterium]|nr:LL-diaminopimelate aminotransferase [Armatimonadota bacterium]MDR7450270.1 LL-diaminopimelate aminotransferase [Armatimonadota bacterium]MDR7467147.1 LL-diaminopimelate aminotransferase [Armatimonadota bacterium]MDR7493311.1 LL-diaminopimelate aminotransferase [Armatimonadota bacterium]MDR7499319.1 LL-diaminopimelate aminotransferase [Armatimonadota bacterium]